MRPWVTLVAGAVVYALSAVWAAGQLPAGGIPLHFDASGQADRFGDADDVITLWTWLGLGMLALGAAVTLLAQRGPLRFMNIPHRAYWTAPSRVATLRSMLAADVATVLGATLVFLALIPVWTVLGARSVDGSALDPLLIWLPIALYLVGILTWTIWFTRRRYRPREG